MNMDDIDVSILFIVYNNFRSASYYAAISAIENHFHFFFPFQLKC